MEATYLEGHRLVRKLLDEGKTNVQVTDAVWQKLEVNVTPDELAIHRNLGRGSPQLFVNGKARDEYARRKARARELMAAGHSFDNINEIMESEFGSSLSRGLLKRIQKTSRPAKPKPRAPKPSPQDIVVLQEHSSPITPRLEKAIREVAAAMKQSGVAVVTIHASGKVDVMVQHSIQLAGGGHGPE